MGRYFSTTFFKKQNLSWTCFVFWKLLISWAKMSRNPACPGHLWLHIKPLPTAVCRFWLEVLRWNEPSTASLQFSGSFCPALSNHLMKKPERKLQNSALPVSCLLAYHCLGLIHLKKKKKKACARCWAEPCNLKWSHTPCAHLWAPRDYNCWVHQEQMGMLSRKIGLTAGIKLRAVSAWVGQRQ